MTVQPDNEMDSDSSEAPQADPAKAAKVAAARAALLEAIGAGTLDTLERRVAWVLNHYPESRDSDITLQLRYWERFESTLGGGPEILRNDLYTLTRLTSLSRARARIQNTFDIFLASPEVQSRRGTLAEEEKERAVAARPLHPKITIYADESGKTDKHLVVGSVWVLHPPETLTVVNAVNAWRRDSGFEEELHFTKISKDTVDKYLSFLEHLSAVSTLLSFKSISVLRAGHKNLDHAVADLLAHLTAQGVEHEHKNGRAPLPRMISVQKDLEEKGRDDLMLANFRERLETISAARFDSQVSIDGLEAIESKGQVLLQIADLYAGSIARALNYGVGSEAPKDRFALNLLTLLHLRLEGTTLASAGDVATHFDLLRLQGDV